MNPLLAALILLAAAGTLLIARVLMLRLFDPPARQSLQRAMLVNIQTLLVLLAVPAGAVMVIIAKSEFPQAILILLAGWGTIGVLFWARRVVPVQRLVQPSPLASVPTFIPVPIPAALPEDAARQPDQADDPDLVVKDYHWQFTPLDGERRSMALQLQLSEERYEALRAEPRLPAGQWAYYVTADLPEIDQLVAGFYELHKDQAWSTLEQASNALSFTQQCITYAYDRDTTPDEEWPRYPLETLMDGTGDCEDDVILVAAVLKRLGFEVALLYYPRHCALGVAGARGLPGEYVVDPRSGLQFFYGETTASGWHLGDIPDKYRGLTPDPIEIIHRVVDQ